MTVVKPGYVYFLHAVDSIDSNGMERYKIGLTTRYVEDRLKELNNGQSPFYLVEGFSIQVSDCEAAESALHEHFKTRRLYFNQENGATGYYDDIDSSVRKSTEWFMFNKHELDSVEDAYKDIQSKYHWQLLPPNKKQQQQATREWKKVTDRFIETNQPRSYGAVGFFVVAILGLVFCAPKLVDFAQDVNIQPAKFNLPTVALPKFNLPSKTKAHTIDASPYTRANIRSSPNGAIVDQLNNGTSVRVLDRRGDWAKLDSGWVWGKYVK